MNDTTMVTDAQERLAIALGRRHQANAIAAFVREDTAPALNHLEEAGFTLAKALDALTQRVGRHEQRLDTDYHFASRLAKRLEAVERRHDDDIMLAYETGYTNSSEAQDHGGTEAAEPDESVQASPPAGAASMQPVPAADRITTFEDRIEAACKEAYVPTAKCPPYSSAAGAALRRAANEQVAAAMPRMSFRCDCPTCAPTPAAEWPSGAAIAVFRRGAAPDGGVESDTGFLRRILAIDRPAIERAAYDAGFQRGMEEANAIYGGARGGGTKIHAGEAMTDAERRLGVSIASLATRLEAVERETRVLREVTGVEMNRTEEGTRWWVNVRPVPEDEAIERDRLVALARGVAALATEWEGCGNAYALYAHDCAAELRRLLEEKP